ncbi:MAG: hypothetical protein GF398_02130 [Chitinivibrionales bacterium]|nr:hypothetical protein [Chitinivibrionales bacterium]
MDKLKEAGFKALNFGRRILRAEDAVPFLISKLS